MNLFSIQLGGEERKVLEQFIGLELARGYRERLGLLVALESQGFTVRYVRGSYEAQREGAHYRVPSRRCPRCGHVRGLWAFVSRRRVEHPWCERCRRAFPHEAEQARAARDARLSRGNPQAVLAAALPRCANPRAQAGGRSHRRRSEKGSASAPGAVCASFGAGRSARANVKVARICCERGKRTIAAGPVARWRRTDPARIQRVRPVDCSHPDARTVRVPVAWRTAWPLVGSSVCRREATSCSKMSAPAQGTLPTTKGGQRQCGVITLPPHRAAGSAERARPTATRSSLSPRGRAIVLACPRWPG